MSLSRVIRNVVQCRMANPPNSSGKSGLHVRILLLPQSLKTVLEHGVMLRVSSNARANGIAYVSIPRSLAKRGYRSRLARA